MLKLLFMEEIVLGKGKEQAMEINEEKQELSTSLKQKHIGETQKGVYVARAELLRKQANSLSVLPWQSDVYFPKKLFRIMT